MKKLMALSNSVSNHRFFAANNNNNENTQQRYSTVFHIKSFTRNNTEGY